MSWGKKWTCYINNNTDLYPLQFANCERLEANDAVYIFDEVGSGKTISSGLMAAHYLYNHSGRVLVITANALAKKVDLENGQFLNDWLGKLPLKDYENRITVINNHCNNICNNGGKWGLVIIDEAHLFLNKDTDRYKELIGKIKADKIVFLTATPIKSDLEDLNVYCDIADKVLEKETDRKWINMLSSTEHPICSMFDPCLPVTRYFKDTIKVLRADGDNPKLLKRNFPELWKYQIKKEGDNTPKLEKLYEKICESRKGEKDKFVIFVRYVETEADVIEKYLKEKNIGLKVKKITGENVFVINNYTSPELTPESNIDILILTYQIAEQGVNLPAFNYVINYHISAFPSSLEQRFGRIDRINSKHDEINMAFLIAENYNLDHYDINTFNLFNSIEIYLNNLISLIPSRNTMLTPEIIEEYQKYINYIVAYKDIIRNVAEKYTKHTSNEYEKSIIEQFMNEHQIIYSEDQFLNDVNTILDDMFFNKLSEDIIKERYDIIDKIENNIFYMNKLQLETISAKDVSTNIGNNINYNEYAKNFITVVEKQRETYKQLMSYSKELEDSFIKNDFYNIISLYLDHDKNQNDNSFIENTPFVKLCKNFDKILRSYSRTKKASYRISCSDGYDWRERFCDNPFVKGIKELETAIKNNINESDLYECFKRLVGENFDGSYQSCLELFKTGDYLMNYNEGGSLVASNWLKLAYGCLNRNPDIKLYESKFIPTINNPLPINIFFKDYFEGVDLFSHYIRNSSRRYRSYSEYKNFKFCYIGKSDNLKFDDFISRKIYGTIYN